MRAEFEKMKNITVLDDIVSIKTRMTDENVSQLEALADKLIASC